MRILVTGGAGFIGSNLVEALIKRGDEVVCLDNFNDFYDPAIKRKNISEFSNGGLFTLAQGDILDTAFLDGVFQKPLALVVGSEGKGIRPQVKKRCDEIYSIPLKGGLESLNASVAAGIAMFSISKDS